MKIKEVAIENFKCFRKATFQLGKLTLLTGANSSGKSSVLYSILGALQSGEFPFQFSPNGKYVEMGDFTEISHYQKQDNTIKIGFSIEDEQEYKIDTCWKQDKKNKLPRLQELVFSGGFFNLKISLEQIYHLVLQFNAPELAKEHLSKESLNSVLNYFLLLEQIGVLPQPSDSGAGMIEEEKSAFPGKAKLDLEFSDFQELHNKILNSGEPSLIRIISILIKIIKTLDQQSNFISSFRHHPQRTYYEKAKSDLRVGKFGEFYEDQIIRWQTDERDEFNELLTVMRELSLLEDISPIRLQGGRYELRVKVKENGIFAALDDVGFGISQFLPVLVADLQLNDDSTLFLAQPEIHLHPSTQSAFGDYIIDRITNTDKRYLIETHSEYLLNKIRLGIVKKKIKPEDVSVYFLENNGDDVDVHQLEFTVDGQIPNAPENFFKTYMMDVMDIAMHAGEE